MILGTRGIQEAYRTGRGKIRVRAVTEIESMPNGKSRILVSELPYMVNKARLIEKMAELVRDKKIDGITAITDESSREGMRINIDQGAWQAAQEDRDAHRAGRRVEPRHRQPGRKESHPVFYGRISSSLER